MEYLSYFPVFALTVPGPERAHKHRHQIGNRVEWNILIKTTDSIGLQEVFGFRRKSKIPFQSTFHKLLDTLPEWIVLSSLKA